MRWGFYGKMRGKRKGVGQKRSGGRSPEWKTSLEPKIHNLVNLREVTETSNPDIKYIGLRDGKITPYVPDVESAYIPFTNGNTAEHYLPDHLDQCVTGTVFFSYTENIWIRVIGRYCGVPVTTPLDDVVAGSLPYPGVSC